MAKGMPYSVSVYLQGDLLIGVYGNGGDLLLKLELSPINLRFVKIGSAELKEFSHLITGSNAVDFKINIRDTSTIYLLVPVNLEIPVQEVTFSRILEAILLAVPSLFRLITVEIFGKRIIDGHARYEKYGSSPYGQNPEFPSPFESSSIQPEMLSEFVCFYIGSYHEKKYLRTPIKYYVANYTYAKREGIAMSYFNLCIALESLLSGSVEITYRLRRFCSVINADDVDMGEKIFKNIGKIYSLRSEIAHVGTFHDDVIDDYREYLIWILSRAIIQLLQSDITSVDDLDKRITNTGFGQKHIMFPLGSKFLFFSEEVKLEFLKDLPAYKRSQY